MIGTLRNPASLSQGQKEFHNNIRDKNLFGPWTFLAPHQKWYQVRVEEHYASLKMLFNRTKYLYTPASNSIAKKKYMTVYYSH
jgi:hypothetical protein